MSVGMRLELKQSQQLVMTPQLQQAIKLLQMSNLELVDFVEAQLAENPLLSRESEEDTGPAAGEPPQTEHADTVLSGEDPRITADVFDTGAEHLEDASPSDGPSALKSEPMRAEPVISRVGGNTDDNWLENRSGGAPTLREHLREQLGQMRAEPLIAMLAARFVEELDVHGLLRRPLAEMAGELGVSLAEAEEALALVQACDPTGVGARDIGECLALQLMERGRFDPAMAALTQNLELVAQGERRKLQQLCGVDAEDMTEMLEELRALDPRPCAGFGVEDAPTLVPDVFVRRDSWGGWEVELNTETLPRVFVDNAYAMRIGADGSAETRRFVADCRSEAGWLMRSLDQRARTILKVAGEIVRHQDAFLQHGIAHLRPMNLRMVAAKIDIHESTASRVTSGKYIATERGIFELKFFFTNAVGGGEGSEGVAAEAVRHRIKALIDAEPANRVLSDDAIVETLTREGVEIARRTVAKYRQALNIPSSVERRRQKSRGAGAEGRG